LFYPRPSRKSGAALGFWKARPDNYDGLATA
jgi:hypothetical protein